jgi:hypothetical protein
MFSLVCCTKVLLEGAAVGDSVPRTQASTLEDFIFFGPWCLEALVPPGGARGTTISSRKFIPQLVGKEKIGLMYTNFSLDKCASVPQLL